MFGTMYGLITQLMCKLFCTNKRTVATSERTTGMIKSPSSALFFPMKLSVFILLMLVLFQEFPLNLLSPPPPRRFELILNLRCEAKARRLTLYSAVPPQLLAVTDNTGQSHIFHTGLLIIENLFDRAKPLILLLAPKACCILPYCVMLFCTLKLIFIFIHRFHWIFEAPNCIIADVIDSPGWSRAQDRVLSNDSAQRTFFLP